MTHAWRDVPRRRVPVGDVDLAVVDVEHVVPAALAAEGHLDGVVHALGFGGVKALRVGGDDFVDGAVAGHGGDGARVGQKRGEKIPLLSCRVLGAELAKQPQRHPPEDGDAEDEDDPERDALHRYVGGRLEGRRPGEVALLSSAGGRDRGDFR